jgi:pimeloyl-ACP methyl ester carboxylesterase
VNGIQLAYEIQGEGDPVVLIAGKGMPAFAWNTHLAPVLRNGGYRVVTFDNRGMPPSDASAAPYTMAQLAADAAGLIEALELTRCRVVGYSVGAMVAQELALARPDLVRAAVLIATMGRHGAWEGAFTRGTVELLRSGVELPRLYDAANLLAQIFEPAKLADDAFMKAMLAALSAQRWDGPGCLGQWEATAAYDDRLEALKAVCVPCLVVGFGLDVITNPTLCREVAAAIPRARYVEIPGVAHAGLLSTSAEIGRHVLEFFASP